MNRRLSCSFLLLFAVCLTAGCNDSIIDQATVSISSNLETIQVTLVFANTFQSSFSGALELKQYGELFVNPYSADSPFEVGFYLNTSIVNDQDYVKLTPTEVMPNGVPIGIGYALVQVQAPQPVNSQFDLYGYVDVLHGAWLGAAVLFNFLNDKNFTDGLTLEEVFLRDSSQVPTLIGSAFGPTLNTDGTLKQSAGVTVFANVAELISQAQASGAGVTSPMVIKPQSATLAVRTGGEREPAGTLQ